MLWYEHNPPWGKWHLVGTTCCGCKSGLSRHFGAALKHSDPTEPTFTPPWSTIPLPAKAFGRICKVCWKKASNASVAE